MLEDTEGAIKNGQSRETGNIGYTRYKMKTKQNKNTTQYMLDITICKHMQITHLRYEPSYKQPEVKTNSLFYMYAYVIILITYKFCNFGKCIACSDSIPVN